MGKRILVWNGKNDSGVKMVEGSYFIKVNDTVRKIILKH
jgi:hypothetical protein